MSSRNTGKKYCISIRNNKEFGQLPKLFIISYAYAVLFTRISTTHCQYLYDIGVVWSSKIKSDGDFE